MSKKLLITSLLAARMALPLQAQQAWSLERCVEYAQQNSLSVKQAQNQVRAAELGLEQARFSRLPSLNGTVSGGMQFGRTIDPTTNTFDNRRIGFNSYGLNFGVALFAGNRINNNIQIGRLDLSATQLDALQTANDLGLNVATAYLNILLSEEQLGLARQRLGQSQLQLEQTDKLIQAGARPVNERLNILSQIALDEQAVVQAENTVSLNYLALKQLLMLDPGEPFRIVRPVINIPTEVNPDDYSSAELFVAALGAQPNIQASEKRIGSATKGIELARAGYYPTLNFFGGMNSNYSSASRRVAGFQDITIPQTVIFNGQTVTFQIPQQVPSFEENPYFNQINQNFGQNLGLSLSVPIYNNNRNKISVERARLNLIQQENNNLQLRQNLKTNVDRAIADAKAARRTLDAAQSALDAADASLQNATVRYEVGAINALELQTARNAKDQASSDLLRAKYQYLFNVKLVEFYQGRKITLD
jgi:outer membrane protein